jgi:tRNA A-37 threonylcarbamoyl transferase component Bud32
VAKAAQSGSEGTGAFPMLAAINLEGSEASIFQKGEWGKADILLLQTGEKKAIVKDFNRKILPVRWYGRWQIRREASIYRRLAGIPGVPRYFGRIGKNAMAIEYIEGERISHWRRRELPPQLFPRLWKLIETIHSRGIVHIDLRKRDNILISAAGEVFIIDFNASFRFEPGGLAGRWLLPALKRIDHFGFLKWKATLAPAQLTEAERSVFRRMSFLRRFWIFK